MASRRPVGVQLFVRECSREDCVDALELTLAQYEEVRRRGDRFLVADGHEIEGIERIVNRQRGFVIVEKIGRAGALAVDHDPRRR